MRNAKLNPRNGIFILLGLISLALGPVTVFADDPASSSEINAVAGNSAVVAYPLSSADLEGATSAEIAAIGSHLEILNNRHADCYLSDGWFTSGRSNADGSELDCTDAGSAIGGINAIKSAIAARRSSAASGSTGGSTPGTGATGGGTPARTTTPRPTGAGRARAGIRHTGSKSGGDAAEASATFDGTSGHGSGTGGTTTPGATGADPAIVPVRADGHGTTGGATPGSGLTGSGHVAAARGTVPPPPPPGSPGAGGVGGSGTSGGGSAFAGGPVTVSPAGASTLVGGSSGATASPTRRVSTSGALSSSGAASPDMSRTSPVVVRDIPVSAINDADKPFDKASLLVGVMQSSTGTNPEARLAGALYLYEKNLASGAATAARHWAGVVPMWESFGNRKLNFQIAPTLASGARYVFNVQVQAASIGATDSPDRRAILDQIRQYEVLRDSFTARLGAVEAAVPVRPSAANRTQLNALIKRARNRRETDSALRLFLRVVPDEDPSGPCVGLDPESFVACQTAIRDAAQAMNELVTVMNNVTNNTRFNRLKVDPATLRGNERIRAEKYQANIPILEQKLDFLRATYAGGRDAAQARINSLNQDLERRFEVVVNDFRKAFLADHRNDLTLAHNTANFRQRLRKIRHEVRLQGRGHPGVDAQLTGRVVTNLNDLNVYVSSQSLATVQASSITAETVRSIMALRQYLNSVTMTFVVYPSRVKEEINAGLTGEGFAAGASSSTPRYMMETLPIFRPISTNSATSDSWQYIEANAGSRPISISPLNSPFISSRDVGRDSSGRATGPEYRALAIFDVGTGADLMRPRVVYFRADSGDRTSNANIRLGRGADSPCASIESAGLAAGRYRWNTATVNCSTGQVIVAPPPAAAVPASTTTVVGTTPAAPARRSGSGTRRRSGSGSGTATSTTTTTTPTLGTLPCNPPSHLHDGNCMDDASSNPTCAENQHFHARTGLCYSDSSTSGGSSVAPLANPEPGSTTAPVEACTISISGTSASTYRASCGSNSVLLTSAGGVANTYTESGSTPPWGHKHTYVIQGDTRRILNRPAGCTH
ncbi:MAG: hypothetical protein HYT79_01975 [Elusimicrobia bacterium]|nr:hypothetical protein [Elusimicrobiota bacterium]